MKDSLPAAAGIVLIVALSVWANHWPAGGRADVFSVALSLDNDTYHSNEDMRMDVIIGSSGEGEVTVMVYGIPDVRGNYRVSSQKNVSLSDGRASFDFRMPSCYGCAGVSPGEYDIVCEILDGKKILASENVTVRLEL